MSLECITLKDETAGASARILPGLGFNCFEWQLSHAGRRVDVLWAAADFAAGSERPSGSGIPLLFPFPGRIPGTRFRWEGREYPLVAGDGRGNAIHGFVLDRPWRVLQSSATRVVGEFHASRDDPSLRDRWPADFRIRVDYELTATALKSQITIDNPDDKPLPCGLGTHPYFRLPLGGGSADECLVQLPVTRRWELVDMLPTGRCLAVDDAAALQAGRPFAELQLDDVFSGLQFADGLCRASIHDPGSGTRLRLLFDDVFRECVVYTPPHREAICIEPYTCVPGAYELQARGEDVGWRVLPPGEAIVARVEMQLDPG